MSTIYSDAAENKYLGDCLWNNHDIQYPTVKYPKFATSNTLQEVFDDFKSIFISSGYNNIYTPASIPAYGSAVDIFRFTFPSITDATKGFRRRQVGTNYNYTDATTVNNGTLTGFAAAANASIVSHFQYEIAAPSNVPYLNYAVTCGPRSYACIMHSPTPSSNKSFTDTEFTYYGLLENVNPQYSYYTNIINHSIILNSFFTPGYSYTFNSTPQQITFSSNVSNHYIVSATKALLTTGRAAYTISCSDGQTPGSQWATDMWVYDNNSTLGFPVIGRVPNMLLGIGSYIYLKPVKIQGSVFPDGGSPWYLPVGTFAGKVLLTRCYSSVV